MGNLKNVILTVAGSLCVLWSVCAPMSIGQQPDNASAPQSEAIQLSLQANELYPKAQFKQANPLVDRVLDLIKDVPSFANPDVAQALAHRADLYYYSNDNKNAALLYEREIQMRDALHWYGSADHDGQFRLLCEMTRLAISYNNLHEYKLAEPVFKRAIAELEQWKKSKEIDNTTVSAYAMYALCLRGLGKTSDAEQIERLVNAFSATHPRGLD